MDHISVYRLHVLDSSSGKSGRDPQKIFRILVWDDSLMLQKIGILSSKFTAGSQDEKGT